LGDALGDFVDIFNSVPGQCKLLRSLNNTDYGELEREMEEGPDLLANRSVVAMGKVIEVECPDKDL
jgi:hypothetical protein